MVMSLLTRKDKAIIVFALLIASTSFIGVVWTAITEGTIGHNSVFRTVNATEGYFIGTDNVTGALYGQFPTVTATNGYFYGNPATNITDQLFGDFGILPITGGDILGTSLTTAGNVVGGDYYIGATDVSDHLTSSLQEANSYTVFTAGGNYYAKNGGTGQIGPFGANATTVLQAVISLGGKIFIKNGVYPCQKLSLPSNIVLQFESRDAILKLPNGVNANTYMFTNSDPVNGNTGIILVDGTLEGAEENQTAGSMYGLSFTNVSESYINMWIQGFRSYDAHLNNCDIELENRWYGDKWNQPVCLYAGLTTRGAGISFELNITISPPIDLRNKYITYVIDDFSDTRSISTKSVGYSKLSWTGTTTSAVPYTKGWTDGDYIKMAQSYDTTSESNNVPSLKAVTSLRIYGWDNDQYHIGEVWARPLPSEGLWTFCFDDGVGGNVAAFATTLSNYNYRGTVFYMSTVGDPNTLVDNLYNAYNWDVSSHSYTHVRMNSTLTPNEYLIQLYNSKIYLQERGWSRGSEYFAFPYNAGGDYTTWDYMRKIYIDARPVTRYSHAFDPLTPWISNYVAGTTDQSLFRAKKWHTWEFLIHHDSDAIDSVNTDCLKVNAVGLKVVTMADIYIQYQPSNKERIGLIISNSGSDTILNGTTSIVINHGLGYTPTSGNTAWTVSYLENPTNDPGSWYIDTMTATQATIHVLRDPGVSHLDIAWSARRTP